MGRLLQKLLLAALLSGLALLYFLLDARKGFFPQCPFYTLLHYYCPGCGSQRAVSALLHGQVIAALQYNVLLVALLPFLLYAAGLYFFTPHGKQVPLFYNPLFTKILLITVISFWLLRNIPFYPFILLAP